MKQSYLRSELLRYFIWQLLLPLLILSLIIFWITQVVYSGSFDSQPALRANFALTDMVLKQTLNSRKAHVGVVKVINISDDDTNSLPAILDQNLALKDLTIESYVQVLEKVLLAEPRFVLLRWLPILHQGSDNQYQPLIQMIENFRSHNKSTQIVLAQPQNGLFKLPKELTAVVQVVDDDLCTSFSQTCPFDSEWNDWAPQVVLNAIESTYPKSKLSDWNYTDVFNTTFPNYVLYLTSNKELDQLSLQEFKSRADWLDSSSFVFIGREILKPVPEEFIDTSILHMKTIYNKVNPSIYGEVTPLHQFWAQIADMVLSQKTPKIPYRGLQNVILVVLILLLALMFYYFSIELSFFVMIFILLFIYTLNLWLLPWFNVYAPTFDLFYVTIFGSIFFGFISLLLSSFRYLVEKVDHEQVMRASHIQTNFISLLSHNLFTPVARMQGALSQLQIQQPQLVTKECQHKVMQLEATLGAILKRLTLQVPQPITTARSLIAIVKEFEEKMLPKLKKLDLNAKLHIKSDVELNHLPVYLNETSLLSFWYYAFFLLHRMQATGFVIEVELLMNEEDCLFLNHKLSPITGGRFDAKQLAQLLDRSLESDDFYIKLYAQTVSETLTSLGKYRLSAEEHLYLAIELGNDNRVG